MKEKRAHRKSSRPSPSPPNIKEEVDETPNHETSLIIVKASMVANSKMLTCRWPAGPAGSQPQPPPGSERMILNGSSKGDNKNWGQASDLAISLATHREHRSDANMITCLLK